MIEGRYPYNYQALNSCDRFLLHGILYSWRWDWRGRGSSAVVFGRVGPPRQRPSACKFRFLVARFRIFSVLCRSRPGSSVLCPGCYMFWGCNQIFTTSHLSCLLSAHSFIWATSGREKSASTDRVRWGSCPLLFVSFNSVFFEPSRIYLYLGSPLTWWKDYTLKTMIGLDQSSL
jgi:hypothetical protein